MRLFFRSRAYFSGFVEVFDGGFVDQHSGFSAYLDGIAIVPLDYPVNARAVLEDEDHLGLQLDLLLQVEKLGLAVGSVVFRGKRGEVPDCRGR